MPRGVYPRAPRRPAAERFWVKVQKSADCWLWTASLDRTGYGVFALSAGHFARAHRYAYELLVGPIPDGLFLCHRCDVRTCVNPAHMFIGTAKDNTDDMHRKGRWVVPYLTQTHCRHGHEFTESNTYRSPPGWRSCRECSRVSNRRTGKIRRQARLQQATA